MVGLHKAREMLFFGEKYTAIELLASGVAWKVTPDEELLDQAQKIAENLANMPILSVRAMKRVLNATASTDLNRALALETEATVAGFMDPETTRLLSAF